MCRAIYISFVYWYLNLIHKIDIIFIIVSSRRIFIFDIMLYFIFLLRQNIASPLSFAARAAAGKPHAVAAEFTFSLFAWYLFLRHYHAFSSILLHAWFFPSRFVIWERFQRRTLRAFDIEDICRLLAKRKRRLVARNFNASPDAPLLFSKGRPRRPVLDWHRFVPESSRHRHLISLRLSASDRRVASLLDIFIASPHFPRPTPICRCLPLACGDDAFEVID